MSITKPIRADDPDAIQKLEARLAKLQALQDTMKAANAYYCKNKTLDGCPGLSPEQIKKMKADMPKNWHPGDKPFFPWRLSNNSAKIRRVKARIEQLTRQRQLDDNAIGAAARIKYTQPISGETPGELQGKED